MRSAHRLVWFFAAFLATAYGSPSARAIVQLIEDAESGLGGIIDHTTGGYTLLQNEIVGQGTAAFHLAHPVANVTTGDNWFEINQNVTVDPASKLFFLSRLGWAGAAQIAKVQASTNGGASWPTMLYSQNGSGGSGEGSFTLKSIDLSSLANQSARFRFYYDLTPGSFYNQTSPGVGWYIDNIQIADSFQKSQYSIGDPTAQEQLSLEYLNRARANAIVEANRLGDETTPSITSAYSSFGITKPNIVNQFTTYVNDGVIALTAQPLSFNAALNLAADLHSQDMKANQFQGHSSSGSPPAPFLPGYTLGQRLDAVGYSGSGGENVYAHQSSVAEGHAAFDVDWGNVANVGDPDYYPAFNGQGMQNPAGHRRNIHNDSFKEIGIGIVEGPKGAYGPQYQTQDFGNPGAATFITGVVYQDLNGNNFYDVGEGRSGVRVDVEGSAYYALSSTSGGYSVPVSGDGVYPVSFTGGGYASFLTTATVAGGRNVKVDSKVTAAAGYAADFDNDGDVDRFDLAKWQGDFGLNGGSDADNDGDSDGNDLLIWQRQKGLGPGELIAAGAAVPEPGSVVLAFVGLAACRRLKASSAWRAATL